ncbi:uncharacterized protein M421DRAFT_88636 [Didymella exigua CBS 183.55]|uniref:Heterokaryon incompatibility domain-containing protein n=1 Tax=Didymella exigua CBS 183.55 TaxID=1150837 RepID=A0A6A5S4K9_9PLEO|nr:uncharacterized protein M421DRAFT_88636 [Didymella exigua CBS 183.55]KAF1933416.1 hypothetical protein M421DRAFT_88636 [Didymella exigua CBS 183.55]
MPGKLGEWNSVWFAKEMCMSAEISADLNVLRRILPMTHACSHVKCANVKLFSSRASSVTFRVGFGRDSSIEFDIAARAGVQEGAHAAGRSVESCMLEMTAERRLVPYANETFASGALGAWRLGRFGHEMDAPVATLEQNVVVKAQSVANTCLVSRKETGSYALDRRRPIYVHKFEDLGSIDAHVHFGVLVIQCEPTSEAVCRILVTGSNDCAAAVGLVNAPIYDLHAWNGRRFGQPEPWVMDYLIKHLFVREQKYLDFGFEATCRKACFRDYADPRTLLYQCDAGLMNMLSVAMSAISSLADARLPTEPYQYEELPPDAFRYLALLPGVDSDPLRCSLHTSRIDGARYESVSYVWGTDDRNHRIVCDGRVLKITPNLHRVLQRVRLPDAPRTLWADSICINQEDLLEKSDQVTLMGRIYRNAERVLLCMGSSGEEHGPAVAALLEDVCGKIDSILQTIRGRVDELESAGKWEPQWSPRDWFPYVDADEPVLSDARWVSVNVLVEQDWFSRGWVVREAGLASQAEDRFRSHLEAYEAQHQDIVCTFYQEGSWKPCSLLDYIHFARALQLKDPRDRIYAFLDLANDSTRQLSILPNYNDTPLNVYRDFATDYVLAMGAVDLLHYVKHDEASLKSISMTWAPDWSIREDNFISFVSTSDNYPPLRSREGHVSTPKLLGGTTLQVEGAVVGSVLFASRVLQGSATTSAVLFELWTSVRQSRPETHYYSSDLLEAFFDALSMANFYGDMDEWMHARRTYITAFERLSMELYDSGAISWDAEEVDMLESSNVHKFLSSTTAGKRFIVTERGCFGLAPHVAQIGDSCAIIFGCSSPCLLRSASSGGRYIYLGPGFILGKKMLELDGYGTGFYSCLGVEESKDWVEWDVQEQCILLS